MEEIKTNFEEFERVSIPAKGITGTIIDIYRDLEGTLHYTVENDKYGDVDDPDAWNIGYAQFDCSVDQIAKIEPED